MLSTGHEHYRAHYLQILAIRDGREPRPRDDRNTFWELHAQQGARQEPDGEAIALVELARNAGFTQEELRVLTAAKSKSDTLARLEQQAIGTVGRAPPDSMARLAAIGSLYDETYRRARVGILQSVAEVDRLVDDRTQAAVVTASHRAYQMRIVFIALGLLQVLLLWRMHRQLGLILGGSVRDVYETIARLGRGDFSPAPSRSRSGDSVLGWLAASSTQLAKLELWLSKAIVQGSDDAIISQTPQGIVTSWNPGAERMFGATAAEAIGQSIELLIPEERADEQAKMLERMSRGELVDNHETRRRLKDGRVIDVSSTVSPILDDHGRVVGIARIARDITAVKQLADEVVRHRDNLWHEVEQRTAELVVAKVAADDANRAKSAFLATTSHELRTPLNAIIGFSSLLLEDMMGELSGQQRKALTIVHRSGEELLVLVRDILDLSAIEAGNLEVKLERVPLRSLLEDLCEAFQAQAEGQGLELRPVICDPGVTVQADRARLAQVVRNLLGNAMKFTDQGYVLVRAVHAGDSMRVEVEDSGIGIPASEQHRLFQSFQRVNDPHGRMRAGTGLGLSICKRIAEAMGGQVGVDSVPGRGSRFWFTAPVAADEKVPITA
jgi:PAS domain S-box-containing protein